MAAWLDEHFDDVSVKDTVDLHEEFLNSNTKLFENHYSNHSNKRKKA